MEHRRFSFPHHFKFGSRISICNRAMMGCDSFLASNANDPQAARAMCVEETANPGAAGCSAGSREGQITPVNRNAPSLTGRTRLLQLAL
jgi:hypothetical protein